MISILSYEIIDEDVIVGNANDNDDDDDDDDNDDDDEDEDACGKSNRPCSSRECDDDEDVFESLRKYC